MVQFYKKALWGLILFIIPGLALSQEFKVVGYLTNWGSLATDAANVDYTKVTHINIAFINPLNAAGKLGPVTGLSSAVTTIHSKNRKVLISMGGATAYANYPYWPTLINATNRGPFISTIMSFLKTYNIDGVDMDLEGDDVDANYNAFVIQLSDSLKAKNKIFSAALGTWFAGKISVDALDSFDWINAMAYDQYGTWTGPGEHSTFKLAQDHLNFWLNTRGLSSDKVVLGLPFYGYRWESTGNTSLGYCDVISNWPRAANQDTIKTATKGFVSHNGIPTIKQKTVLAHEKCSGVMIWTLQYDCPATNPNSLLFAINETLGEINGNKVPTVTLTGPANGSVYTEGDKVTLTADAADEDGTISYVIFYNGINKIAQTASAPYSYDWFPEAGTYTLQAKALDNVPATASSNTITITVNPASEQLPFKGVPFSIPGKIEMEDFDQFANLGYYDSDPENQGGAYRNTSVDIEPCNDAGGGYNIGYVAPGEWLEYTSEVAKDSVYDIDVRYASNNSLGGTFSIEIDGQNISGTVNTTNGWQTWKSITLTNVALTKGSKVMRFNILSGEYNLNYVTFSYHKKTTGIVNNSESTNKISFYPNPFTENGTIQLDVRTSGLAQISIIDLTGKELLRLPEFYLTEGINYIQLDGNQLQKGFYLCRIIQNEKLVSIPIKKQ